MRTNRSVRNLGARHDPIAVPVGVVDVEVVREEIADAKDKRDIVGRREIEIVDHGRIVGRCDDMEIDIASVETALGGVVGDPVEKACRRGRVQIGRENDIALAVRFKRAVEILIGPEFDETDRIAIDIGIVGKEGRDRNDDRHIFENFDEVIVRDRRRVTDIVEPERHLAVVDKPFGIGDKIIEARLAPIIGVGREDDGAMVGEADVAVDGGRHAALIGQEGQGQPFRIAVILEQFGDRDFDRDILAPAKEMETRCGIMVIACNRPIIDRLIGDCRTSPGEAALPVADAVIEPGIAVEIGGRREEDRLVLQQLRAAAMRGPDRDDRQRITVRVEVVRQQAGNDRAVHILRQRIDDDRIVFENRPSSLGRLDPVGDGLRRIIDRREVEIDARGRCRARRVLHHIVEMGIAPEIIARSNRDHAIGANRHGNIGVRDDRLDRQNVAIDIAVVGDERQRVDFHRHALGARDRPVIAGDRRIVHRGDVDRDLRIGSAALGRVRQIAEFGEAVEIGVRREGDVAVARERDGAILRTIYLTDDHPVAVEVVRKEALDADGDRTVFGYREAAVVDRGRDGADADVDRGGVECVATVRNRVAERRGSVEAAVRGEDDIALGIDRRHAIVAAIDCDDADRVAVGIEVVAQEIGRQDGDRLPRGQRVVAIVNGRRRAIVDEIAHRRLGPFDPVGEANPLHALAVGGQRVDNCQAVARRRLERDDHGLAAAEEARDRRFL